MEVLHVENLSFGYEKSKLLYDNFSLTLHVGEVVAIVGESGAGKSTLFELILGNLKPNSGTVKALRVSEVFQDPYSSFHPSYTILNQIEDVASLENIDYLKKRINVEDRLLNSLPHKLSGGELQRCSILRALLMKPNLLLLDEPTSALDNVIQLDVMKLLVNELDDMGMLLITHDVDLAAWIGDRIITI
ncbi:MAG: ATP-binding cassette domain-containing protein [Campylobacterota bacterium]|nr:ATP-binding cassette domain-containing protein [Campylobacterota bacterium]